MADQTMRIGQAAANAGVKLQTLHYYERRGLLQPARTESNYRTYTEDAVMRVRFIKRAQELGFTLEQIKELLALRIDSTATCADVRVRAEARLSDVREKIQTLRSMESALERLTTACSGDGAVTDCPILESLDQTGGP